MNRRLIISFCTALLLTACKSGKQGVMSGDDAPLDSTEVVGNDVEEAAEDVADNNGQLPPTAKLQDEYRDWKLYVNEEQGDDNEGDYEAIQTVWLVNGKTGAVTQVCRTNPKAVANWELMKERTANAVDVPLDQIAAAEKAYIASTDGSKVIVEGCPDGRNVWTYVINTKHHTARQYPSNEGVDKVNITNNEVVMHTYAYDDDGRYSYRVSYTIDGLFMEYSEEKER